MTKKMIDPDALLEFIKQEITGEDLADTLNLSKELNGTPLGTFENGYTTALNCLLEKISELATPAPQEENIFDADGWCWDMDKAPKNELIVLFFVDGNEKFVIDDFLSKYLDFSGIKAWRPLPNIPSKGDL